MIASWMAFLLVVSVMAGAAAALLEGGLGRWGAPTRWAWLGALALGPVLLGVRVAALLGPEGPPQLPPPPAWLPILELPPLLVGPSGAAAAGFGVPEAAGAVWLLAALAMLAILARTHAVLLRERAGWESARVLGQDVYVSTDRGPAVAGVWRPWIVLPRWALDLPAHELRMVLLHEAEHLRARDTRLLAGALALVALSAWNPVTWWQLRRLRAAMEVDCDRRVLRQAPDRACYGSSLLAVAARASGPSLGLAAFTERSLNLKRRILAMTSKTSRWTAVGGGVLVLVGLVVGVQACGVDTPVGITPVTGPMPALERAAPPVQAGGQDTLPTFTPFTVAPTILNRDEVIRRILAEYPEELRNAGIGGTARLYFFIDADGQVADVRMDRSSGHEALDQAALRVARVYRFSPALNREERVPVWVSFPITFRVR